MKELYYLRLVNTNINVVVDNFYMFYLSRMCRGIEYPNDFGILDLLFFTRVHKEKDSIPKSLVCFVEGYIARYEDDIANEIMEPGGGYDKSIDDFILAKELFYLSQYCSTVSEKPEFWEIMHEDMREIILSLSN